MDDLSQQVASLKNLLISDCDLAEERFSKASVDHAEMNTMDAEADVRCKDRNGHSSSTVQVNHSLSVEEDENGPAQTAQKQCIMSLDISEYELEMLEMQARQEENDEQSILAFEVCGFRVFVVICVLQF